MNLENWATQRIGRKVQAGLGMLSAVALLGLQACTGTIVSPAASDLHTYVKTSLSVDITTGEEITGVASATVILKFFTFGAPTDLADPEEDFLSRVSPMETLRAGARYNALSSSKADLILLPRYTAKIKDYLVYREVEVTVTGYKGTLGKPTASKN
jgi:hypothetical protein